jgi:hypothetical protein
MASHRLEGFQIGKGFRLERRLQCSAHISTDHISTDHMSTDHLRDPPAPSKPPRFSPVKEPPGSLSASSGVCELPPLPPSLLEDLLEDTRSALATPACTLDGCASCGSGTCWSNCLIRRIARVSITVMELCCSHGGNDVIATLGNVVSVANMRGRTDASKPSA